MIKSNKKTKYPKSSKINIFVNNTISNIKLIFQMENDENKFYQPYIIKNKKLKKLNNSVRIINE